jgi:bile acid-coenzyme A ligase
VIGTHERDATTILFMSRVDEQSPSLGARTREIASSRPDDVAVRHVAIDGSERSCTWAELDRRSDRLAGALEARGLGLGDRLGLGLRNSIEFVLSVLAAWKLGAAPVPIRWDLPEWEFSRLRDVVDAKVFLGADDMSWIGSTATHPVAALGDVIGPNDVGICSSGSTGLPKVILSQRPGVYLDVLGTPMMQNWRPVERPQTILVLAPMYHTNGFSTLYTLLGGDTLVIMEKFDAERVVDVIERHRVSTFTATPTMLQRIADLPGVDGRDFSSIDWILQGAAPMPPSLVHRWIGFIGAERIIMAYGMTESVGITVLRGDEWLAHEGSVGTGFRGTEIRILDDGQCDVPVGDIGEIYLRNPVYGGSEYLGPAPAMRGTGDGFFTVGDLGYVDVDGYVYLVDRRVDVIITGGANVFPSEVEAALIDHPQIADVVAIGLSDPEWGKRVHVIVAPSRHTAPPSADEVIAYAKSRLAAYKVPKTVEFVDEIPRSAATKVNRGALIAAREADSAPL